MKKIFLLLVSMNLVFLFTFNPAHADIWPMQEGQEWVYEANEYPSGGPMNDVHVFVSEVTIDSQQYFHFWGGVYEDGCLRAYEDSYFRFTESQIFEWGSDVGGETLFFQEAPIGTTWSHGTNNTVKILDDNFTVNIPYDTGNYSAYKLQFSDPKGIWNIYVVPGFGIVQLDQLDLVPSHILKLKSISPVSHPVEFQSIPTQGAVDWGAIGDGY